VNPNRAPAQLVSVEDDVIGLRPQTIEFPFAEFFLVFLEGRVKGWWTAT
jgi:hypothetical protein